MRYTIIEKEWAEVRRNGIKTEDWSWTVDFFEDDRWINRQYINSEVSAKMISKFFEADAGTRTKFGGVSFDNVFEDVSAFELELEEMFDIEVDDSTIDFEVL